MINQSFGKWKVIKEVKNEKSAHKVYLCKCICGIERLIRPSALKLGITKGCPHCNSTHKMAGSPTYKIWVGMLTRCNNSKVKIYPRYGGRGIKVSAEWHNFENFYKDMGERPAGLELDRINNDGNYEVGNCRWVTRKENTNNRSLIDNMPGKKFGKWSVIERIYRENQNHWYYKCICDCGYETIKPGGELRRGKTTQCRNCKNIAHRNWPERLKNERRKA